MSAVAEAPKLLTQAAYARHRNVSPQTVSDYKRRGQLVMVGDLVDVIASDDRLLSDQNPVLGGKLDDDNSRPKTESEKLFRAKVREAEAKATEREIRSLALADKYIDRDIAEVAVFTLARTAQESIMAVADRLAPALAVESDPVVIHKTLSDELRATCQQIANDSRGLL